MLQQFPKLPMKMYCWSLNYPRYTLAFPHLRCVGTLLLTFVFSFLYKYIADMYSINACTVKGMIKDNRNPCSCSCQVINHWLVFFLQNGVKEILFLGKFNIKLYIFFIYISAAVHGREVFGKSKC